METPLERYYTAYNEDARLLSRTGRVEYLTTMRYLHRFAPKGTLLEIGAGTGRYSIALAKEGYDVTAVEPIPHNLDVLKRGAAGLKNLTAHRGDARDLGFLPSDAFDATLLLGPMYHLYTDADRLTALSEAVRVTRPGGYVFVAYCLNESVVIQYAFLQDKVTQLIERGMLTSDWHCISKPEDLFAMLRTEEIDALNRRVPATPILRVAADGAAHYLKEKLNAMDEATYARWLDYHFATCERADLIGASNHALDILQK